MAQPPEKTEQTQDNPSDPSQTSEGGTQHEPDTGNGLVYDEAREVILEYIQDFAAELGDQAKLRSSVSRAHNLFRKSGVDLSTFIARMHEARSITKERTANIRKQTKPEGSPWPVKSRMAYWFATLTNLLEGRSGPEGWEEKTRAARPRGRRSSGENRGENAYNGPK